MRDMREIRAVLVGAAVVATYLCLVLLTGRVPLGQFSLLFLAYVSGTIALWVALGTIVMFVQIFRRMRHTGSSPFLFAFFRESLEARWKRDRGASLLWPPLLFAALMASFNAFKQMVLPIAGFRFDPWLADADRVFFFGHDGWRVVWRRSKTDQTGAGVQPCGPDRGAEPAQCPGWHPDEDEQQQYR